MTSIAIATILFINAVVHPGHQDFHRETEIAALLQKIPAVARAR